MLKKQSSGFTLIELLAVIVILGIIFLISVPMILNVMEDTAKASFKITAGMIVRAADSEYSKKVRKNQEITNLKYEYVNGEFTGEKDLDYKGKRPKDGVVNITEEGEVELSIHDGTFCAWKEIDSNEIHVEKKTKEECGVE
ncbi:MAG: type II secretion system protein, partial [Bacilli bacterium]|nr:type II secretion system protein [Bacilli bacterium]